MDMSHSGSGNGNGNNKEAGGGGYYALAEPPTPPKSYSPYFSLPRSYKAPTPRDREREEAMGLPRGDLHLHGQRGDLHLGLGPALQPRGVHQHRVHPGSSSSSSSFPLSAQEEVLSPGSSAAVVCCSPHQDYMSVELHRPLASNAGLLASQPGGPPRAGGHWKALGDDYTDMTFNLSRGGEEGPRASPTAVLQHLCVMEGHYGGHPAPASSSTSAHAPGSPSRTGAEPKVVRADPQGRRRHSSETFTSPPSSSVTATPTTASATSTLGLPSSTTDAPNGAHPADGVLPCRWSGGSGSFDSVWMSVEGLGAESSAPGHAHSHASSSSYSSGRMCRNTSSGYQNGLNYIALELREEAGAMATAATTAMAVAAVPTDGSVAGSNGA
ncbi:hypothetical protein CRUP_023389 [Coryphaenoides rupestris]|nr:hypothetical protein CRUP_023389 [Coryphaenoides rupestris]